MAVLDDSRSELEVDLIDNMWSYTAKTESVSYVPKIARFFQPRKLIPGNYVVAIDCHSSSPPQTSTFNFDL